MSKFDKHFVLYIYGGEIKERIAELDGSSWRVGITWFSAFVSYITRIRVTEDWNGIYASDLSLAAGVVIWREGRIKALRGPRPKILFAV